jgi:hypothetical protein
LTHDTQLKGLLSRMAEARGNLCRLVPAVAVACLLAWCFFTLHSNFAADDADSEILNQAWRLANGKNIYSGIETPPFAFAAYTPVYYAAAAALLRFTGLSYIPAKLLSLAAALSIGLALIRLSRKWHQDGHKGVWAAFLLFLVPAFLYNAVRSHAQMMAVAFSVWSLFFFLRDRRRDKFLISPLLAVLALYTKQTQVAVPLAIGMYLLFRNRRGLLPYWAAFSVAALVPFLWLQKITQGYFLFDTVDLARLAYSLWQIPLVFLHHAGPLLPFIALALLLSWKRFRKGEWGVLDCYLVCLLAITAVSLGRLGAHGQYVLELLVATLIYLLGTTHLPSVPSRDALVSFQVLLLLIYAPLFVVFEEGLWNLTTCRAAQNIYPILKSGPGPILSQQGSLALFGRGEIYIQLFHFSALSRAGLWNQEYILSRINDRVFSWVITEFPLEKTDLSDDDRERFTPELISALRSNYSRRVFIYPYYLYTRNPAPLGLGVRPLAASLFSEMNPIDRAQPDIGISKNPACAKQTRWTPRLL